MRAWRGSAFAVAVALTASACGSDSNSSASGSNDVNGASVVTVVAKQWEYSPSEIKLKKGVPAILEITSMDVHHGFNLPEFNVRADAVPGMKARIQFTPDKAGTFTFHCDFFCGDGHEDMQGELTVE